MASTALLSQWYTSGFHKMQRIFFKLSVAGVKENVDQSKVSNLYERRADKLRERERDQERKRKVMVSTSQLLIQS